MNLYLFNLSLHMNNRQLYPHKITLYHKPLVNKTERFFFAQMPVQRQENKLATIVSSTNRTAK